MDIQNMILEHRQELAKQEEVERNKRGLLANYLRFTAENVLGEFASGLVQVDKAMLDKSATRIIFTMPVRLKEWNPELEMSFLLQMMVDEGPANARQLARNDVRFKLLSQHRNFARTDQWLTLDEKGVEMNEPTLAYLSRLQDQYDTAAERAAEKKEKSRQRDIGEHRERLTATSSRRAESKETAAEHYAALLELGLDQATADADMEKWLQRQKVLDERDQLRREEEEKLEIAKAAYSDAYESYWLRRQWVIEHNAKQLAELQAEADGEFDTYTLTYAVGASNENYEAESLAWETFNDEVLEDHPDADGFWTVVDRNGRLARTKFYNLVSLQGPTTRRISDGGSYTGVIRWSGDRNVELFIPPGIVDALIPALQARLDEALEPLPEAPKEFPRSITDHYDHRRIIRILEHAAVERISAEAVREWERLHNHDWDY